ncbi:5-methyltetrahydropteroyltriglutamate--homocysteine methyltransferase [Glycine soja]|uniref:5-methyltetrahydropteroyltriglutamate--homocysteine methyltransferase n=1 Tax=Glycine soja TaxID=3848 RepID=A0A0B2P391_GLYSO|nr:5-methyltetrahydropteroyltriglutamate--homocysteine methyltransferase [Glycine soja]
MDDAGIKYIPSNAFSYYDQVLDTTTMLGAVPPRYNWNCGEIGFDVYFLMARRNAYVPAMEKTKCFDTNYRYIVPELGSDVKFSYASHKVVDEYKEAKVILLVYREVMAELKAAGATWIQFDEPNLVKDLNAHQLQAFTHAYTALESSLSGLNFLI